MRHHLECVCCKERFYYDAAHNRSSTWQGDGRHGGEGSRPGLFCPRCGTDNSTWYALCNPRHPAGAQAPNRIEDDLPYPNFNLGLGPPPQPATQIQWFPDLSLLDSLVPAHPHFRALLVQVLIIIVLLAMLATVAVPGPLDRTVLVVLILAMNLYVLKTITQSWPDLHEWRHIRKVRRAALANSVPPVLWRVSVVVLAFALLMPLVFYVLGPWGLDVMQAQFAPVTTSPEQRVLVARNDLLAMLEALGEEMGPEVVQESQVLVGRLTAYLNEHGGETVEAPQANAWGIKPRMLMAWLMLLCLSGFVTVLFGMVSTWKFVADQERILPRPVFRDLSLMRMVALRDAERAFNLDAFALNQVTWTHIYQNGAGGLELKGQQRTGRVQCDAYTLKTDLWARILSAEVKPLFSQDR